MHHSRRMVAATRLVAALPLVFAMGCSSSVVQKILAELPEQPVGAVASTSSKSRKAKKNVAAPALPHGGTCVCPQIVTGTSCGCWDAL